MSPRLLAVLLACVLYAMTVAAKKESNIEEVGEEIASFVDEEDLEPFSLNTLDDFKNSTSCAALGYSDLSEYMYAFKVPVRYTSSDSTGDVFLPVLSTHNLEAKNKDVKKIVLAVHGKEGDADTYFCLAKYAADAYSLRHGKGKDEIAIIAPWFGEEQTTGLSWTDGNGKSKYNDYNSVYWATSDWISSSNDATNSTSTFDCMDEIISAMLNPKVFPHAKRAALVGFSAGGQVVARYAWANSVTLTNADSDSEISSLRYIVSDPSSYLYLSPERPLPSCIPLYDSYNTDSSSSSRKLGSSKSKTSKTKTKSKKDKTKTKTTTSTTTSTTGYCSGFSSDSADIPTITDCASYDTWKYGVGGFYSADTFSYFSDFIDGGSTVVSKQSEKLASKDVRFILGTDDVCNCNSDGYTNPDSCYPTDSAGNLYTCTPNGIDSTGCCDTYPGSTLNELSTSCGSDLQGYNRLQRGLVYMSYLEYYWADKEYEPNYYILEGLSHDAEFMYKSDILATWAFSDDDEDDANDDEDVVLVSLSQSANPNANARSSSLGDGDASEGISRGDGVSFGKSAGIRMVANPSLDHGSSQLSETATDGIAGGLSSSSATSLSSTAYTTLPLSFIFFAVLAGLGVSAFVFRSVTKGYTARQGVADGEERPFLGKAYA